MIGVIGLDYKLSNAEQRGRLSFTGERLRAALQALTHTTHIKEAVILSTCNRTEIYYASAEGERAAATVKRLITEAFSRGPEAIISDIPPEPISLSSSLTDPISTAPDLPKELVERLYDCAEAMAAEHLFRVAAGLRSMVIGEAQILGQVKDALIAGETARTVGDELRALFTIAIKVGKRARAETEIGRADLSVASLAVRVAADALGGLTGKRALIIGAGRTSQLCAHLLREQGIDRLMLANRSPSAAKDLARQVGGEPIAMGEIETAIQSAHLVISATAAPHVVLRGHTVARGMAGNGGPLVVVDLAVPPDVAEEVGLLPNVSLYTLDTLRALGGSTDLTISAPRENELQVIEAMIAQGVHDLFRTRSVKLAAPTIAGLRRHVDRSEQAELARALGQLTHLSESDREIIERFGQRLVDKMFHHLVSRIRSLAEYDEVPLDVTMRVLGQLFADPDDQRDETQPQRAASRDERH